ncbi:Docking protein 1 [Collichthys lucidus]|uniref:Docking protein 1 n=1 Tax=Collichthys lucidus TaxID=240159 RepID=A0A4U5U8M8_COLLU|nr:Docking protein 1 [Collichthys lucidus]TKS69376.1 Docking protein 1 [Collichthys lucidus]
MDSQIKTGKAYLQPRKAGKRWKPVWLSLFPQSSSGVGRLEILDVGGVGVGGDHGAGVRRHHQAHVDRKVKVVRLSELISVLRLPPNAEACPMDNMTAFCVETQDRTMVFATLKDDCVEWVEKLCQSTFPRGSNQLHMEENQIYASADEASEFWVVVQRTEAATRCGLQGSYWLQVRPEALLLRETQKKNIVREWPYELLRRYGKDKMTLTIEAGRRCTSGPGTFTFETQQAENIFSLIQSTIKRKTSTVPSDNQNQEGEKVIITNIQAHSPLPKIPDMTSISAILENKLRTQESVPAQKDSSECISAQPAPITLMPLPLVPTHNSHSGGSLSGQSEVVYADPADCIQSVPKPQTTTGLYVDPACVLPLKPPSCPPAVNPAPNSAASNPCFTIDHPDSVYSEVYDKISPVNKQAFIQSKGKAKRFADDEPIYTVPVGNEEVSHKNESKPDPFAHLYAQVCKKTPSSSPSPPPNTTSSCRALSPSVTASMSTLKAPDPDLDDVIYENLGII